jgi:hypothetical protein
MVLLLVAAICIGVFARNTVYWKRRGLQVLFSPATLPANYFEPSQVLEGSEGPATPRVDPEQERLDPASLAAAAQYAARTERLEQRVQVLERIVTDKGLELSDEIERLRDQPLN